MQGRDNHIIFRTLFWAFAQKVVARDYYDVRRLCIIQIHIVNSTLMAGLA